MEIEFAGKIWYWRGPSPFYFITVPAGEAEQLKAISALVTYGWGMIPVHVTIGGTRFYTALWPKDDSYIVPIKASVRKAEELDVDDEVTVRLEIGL